MSPTFSPISLGGVGRATVTSTSGSPTVNNNSRAGKTVYEFNGSGSITIGTAGYAEIAVISGGGGGGGGYPQQFISTFMGGGGGGGVHSATSHFLSAGSHTITVGAGGSVGGNFNNGCDTGQRLAVGYPGSLSKIGQVVVVGGGSTASGNATHRDSLGIDQWGAIFPTQGGGNQRGVIVCKASSTNSLGVGGDGGNNTSARSGGGGGGGASGNNGGNASNNAFNGNGGNGTTVNITGNAVVYGGGGAGTGCSPGNGGGGNANNPGSANTGGGAGTESSGGSGKVIVVIG